MTPTQNTPAAPIEPAPPAEQPQYDERLRELVRSWETPPPPPLPAAQPTRAEFDQD